MPAFAADLIPMQGLGLRRSLVQPLLDADVADIGFLELAPENWLQLGGRHRRSLNALAERFPLVSHGLSLSIGGPDPLDFELLDELRKFFDEYNIQICSEHLSYCAAGGHLYDLMPIPFSDAAVRYVSERIRIVQDVLQRPLIIENVSYYAAPFQEMTEIDFVRAVLAESGCHLLLDVNNVYVNSVNHGYDPREFIDQLIADQIAYYHVAGHYDEAPDLKIDTHGTAVNHDVWSLLQYAYERFGVKPTLLERDFNIPALPELVAELAHIRALQQGSSQHA